MRGAAMTGFMVGYRGSDALGPYDRADFTVV